MGRRTLTSAALNRNGTDVAVGDGKRRDQLWKTSAGAARALADRGTETTSRRSRSARTGGCWSAAAATHDARIWRVSDGKRGTPARRHFVRIRDVEFSPDGRWVVTVGETRVVLWAAVTGLCSRPAPGEDAVPGRRGFATNSRVDRAAGADGTVRAYMCRVCGHGSTSCAAWRSAASRGQAGALPLALLRDLFALSVSATNAAWRKSFAADAASDHVSSRPKRGASTCVAASPAAVHVPTQRVHVTSSPIARCRPSPAGRSSSPS